MNTVLKGEITLTNVKIKIVVQVAEDGSSMIECFDEGGGLIAVCAPFLLTPDIWEVCHE